MRFVAAMLAMAAISLGAQSGDGRAAEFRDPAGGVHALAELRGHPAAVNFWATWRGP